MYSYKYVQHNCRSCIYISGIHLRTTRVYNERRGTTFTTSYYYSVHLVINEIYSSVHTNGGNNYVLINGSSFKLIRRNNCFSFPFNSFFPFSSTTKRQYSVNEGNNDVTFTKLVYRFFNDFSFLGNIRNLHAELPETSKYFPNKCCRKQKY